MPKLTQERLKEVVSYDPESGHFTKIIKGGKPVSHNPSAGGYARITIDGYRYYTHRLVWLYTYGSFPIDQIDHINHDRLDNRVSNLREATDSTNRRNMSKHSTNTSGYTGVCFNKRRQQWHTRINDGAHVGYYNTLYAAVYARHYAEIVHGYHPNHGK